MTFAAVVSASDVLELVEQAVCERRAALRRYASAVEAIEDGVTALIAEWPVTTSTADLVDALQRAQRRSVPIPVIVLLPRGLPGLLARAIAAGAWDVLLMPIDRAEIDAELDEILDGSRGLAGEKRVVFETLTQSDLVGVSRPFRRCLLELQQAASSNANVLLLGETGSGKEMFARAIHRLSDRASEPYVAVNCASLPSHLLETELFGHVRGAFTGADRPREGRFSAVRAGTLLLDEIGDIEPALQMKLLRVIETREFERVGDNAAVRFHGRIIAATAVDLDKAMRTERFRRDLMGRLDQFRIVLPPLRSRREDIPLLARHFLVKHSGGRPVDLSQSAMDLLCACEFPMNVRQLENAIIGAVAKAQPGTLLLPKHLPADVVAPPATPPDATRPAEMRTIEISAALDYQKAREAAAEAVDALYLEDLLRQHDGNQSAAAEAAGIDRKTFGARWKHARHRE